MGGLPHLLRQVQKEGARRRLAAFSPRDSGPGRPPGSGQGRRGRGERKAQKVSRGGEAGPVPASLSSSCLSAPYVRL